MLAHFMHLWDKTIAYGGPGFVYVQPKENTQ